MVSIPKKGRILGSRLNKYIYLYIYRYTLLRILIHSEYFPSERGMLEEENRDGEIEEQGLWAVPERLFYRRRTLRMHCLGIWIQKLTK